ELGMVKFDYLADGRIAGIRDVFSSFNEPLEPIPPDVVALTGITNEMVAGRRIDEGAVSSFADDAVIIIAHNAGFEFPRRGPPSFGQPTTAVVISLWIAICSAAEQLKPTAWPPPRHSALGHLRRLAPVPPRGFRGPPWRGARIFGRFFAIVRAALASL